MIESLAIQGYRCFQSFEVHDLGQVNLLVGKNNCGKSALLEALELVASPGGEADRLWGILDHRGEAFPEDEREPSLRPVYDISHLFTGHEMRAGSKFTISARDRHGGTWRVRCSIAPREGAQPPLFNEPSWETRSGPWVMLIEPSSSGPGVALPVTPRGGILGDVFRRYRQTAVRADWPETTFIGTDSLNARAAENYWKEIALYPEEHLVVDALKLLEPCIERIAFAGPTGRLAARARGGMVVKCSGSEKPIPIGSMGDGMWRMLAMALALVRSRDGVLLVDEIDTGLHYTVMKEMWRMVIATCERLNVQVFATTHSNDCLYSLALTSAHFDPGSVSVQRLESNRDAAVAFSQREMSIAAERQIEIR